MNKHLLSAALALLFCAPALEANITWDWTYTGSLFSGSGSIETASILTTGGLGFTGYSMVAVTGTFNSAPIATMLSTAFFQNNDNLLAAATPQLSIGGFSFATLASLYNIHFSGSGSNYTAVAQNPFATDDGLGIFSATQRGTVIPGVPEPATTALIGSPILFFAWFVRHRRRNVQATRGASPNPPLCARL